MINFCYISLMKKLSLFFLLNFLSINLFAHFPEKMKCFPKVIHICSSSNTEINDESASCQSFDAKENVPSFYLDPEKLEGKHLYSFNSEWFGFSGGYFKEKITMIDMDQQEMPSQMSERFFYARQISGIDNIIDNDISGFATLSGTGHPHVLQFIFANQAITQINVAFCQEVE